ncbi:membrane protein containing Forkhead-associated [Candidatus Magnetobacterium bavaricum]|uniref:Membrane protein containing Forkhead-associated n=1 Tax=Candidatus Magnetobacterium bavaricum TaxID=29290 RepID=A0A0F3GZ68_9BACT|nr:membrane protein containing Forkhead-associated [Candidatus Magnetobacterium bavaricum]
MLWGELQMVKAKRNNLLWLLVFVCFLPSHVFAQTLYTFNIEQANIQLPLIRVYAEILDKNRVALEDVSKITVTGSIGANEVKMEEIKPFGKVDEGIAYIFLVDVSRSLKAKQFKEMQEAITEFISSMKEKDKAAVLTFGKSVNVRVDFTSEKEKLTKSIKELVPSDEQTQLYTGFVKAIELGKRNDSNLPSRRVIITLSDGEDDYAGGTTKEEALDALKTDRIPIYSIGFYNPPSSPKKEDHLKLLGEISRRSGGEYYKAGTVSFKDIYSNVHKKLQNTYVIMVKCEKCTGDGKDYRIQLNLTEGEIKLSDGLNIRIFAQDTLPSSTTQQGLEKVKTKILKSYWFYITLGVILLLIVLFLIARKRKKRKELQQRESQAILADVQLHGNLAPTVVKRSPTDKNAGGHAKGLPIKLVMLGNMSKNKTYDANLVNRIIIGRNKSKCDLLIADEEISSIHCELIREANNVYIRDLGSTNGTSVNGVQIKERFKLTPGDLISLGQLEMRIKY